MRSNYTCAHQDAKHLVVSVVDNIPRVQKTRL